MRSGLLASLPSIRNRDADRCQPHVNAPQQSGAVAKHGLAALQVWRRPEDPTFPVAAQSL